MWHESAWGSRSWERDSGPALALFDFVILASYSLGSHLRRKDLDKIFSESLPAFLNIKYHYVNFLAWYSSEYGKN